MEKYKIQNSGKRTGKSWYSKTAFPIEGGIIARFRIKSQFGTSTATGRSQALRVSTTIPELLENARIQAVFKHLNDVDNRNDKNELGWRRFYGDSDDPIEKSKSVKNFSDDIGDDIQVKLVSYIFEYPKFDTGKRYKVIKVNNKRYLQTFNKKNNRYVFEERFRIEGRLSKTRRMLE